MKEIKDRRSIRKYKNIEVSDKDLLQVLEAGRLAPSGNNMQPWKFIVVKDCNTRKAISEIDHNQEWMMEAPIFIVCLADIKSRIEDVEGMLCDENCSSYELKRAIRDSSVAIGYMLLEAVHLGLGTSWTGWYEQKDAKKILHLPDYMYVTGIITLGYADESLEQRPRKSMEEIVHYEQW